MVTHLPDEFHLLLQAALQEVTELRGPAAAENVGHADLEGLSQVVLQDVRGLPWRPEFFTPLILGWSGHARRGRGHHSGFAFRETLGSLEFLLRQFAEKFG